MSSFSIETTKVFWAYHALRLPDGTSEPVHGHAFAVTVRIDAEKLDAIETVLDFHEVEKALVEIVTPWEGKHLHEVSPFDGEVNSSAERIAEEIGRRMVRWLGGRKGSMTRSVQLAEVRITEAANCLAIWRP